MKFIAVVMLIFLSLYLTGCATPDKTNWGSLSQAVGEQIKR